MVCKIEQTVNFNFYTSPIAARSIIKSGNEKQPSLSQGRYSPSSGYETWNHLMLQALDMISIIIVIVWVPANSG